MDRNELQDQIFQFQSTRVGCVFDLSLRESLQRTLDPVESRGVAGSEVQ